MSDRLKVAEELSGYVYPIYKVLQAVNMSLRRIIKEETEKECGGYRGDGANDPENHSKQNRIMTWGEISYNISKYTADMKSNPDVMGLGPDMIASCDELVHLVTMLANNDLRFLDDRNDDSTDEKCKSCESKTIVRNSKKELVEGINQTVDKKNETVSPYDVLLIRLLRIWFGA